MRDKNAALTKRVLRNGKGQKCFLFFSQTQTRKCATVLVLKLQTVFKLLLRFYGCWSFVRVYFRTTASVASRVWIAQLSFELC